MKTLFRSAIAVASTAGLGLAFLPLSATPAVAATGGGKPGIIQSFRTPFNGTPEKLCGSAKAGSARCLAEVLTPGTISVNTDATPRTYGGHALAKGAKPHGTSPAVVPSGLAPVSIDNVYGFPTATALPNAGSGKTVAIVDAYDDPTIAADLTSFSQQYGLPACTTNSGCFIKVNQTGGTSYPASNSNWALEISLDVEWVHATAPGATVMLVEASSNSFTDLMTAETYAGSHANYVSNSWGASEFSGETSYDSNFSGSATYFAATGDTGGLVEYPASSPKVVAVGGTTLSFSNGTLASETSWSGGGGGCSAYETATTSQASFNQYPGVGCGGKRAVPDGSLDANPNSGVAVLDSTPYNGNTGWWTVGGTSVSTPIWAAEAAVQATALGAPLTSQTIYGSAMPFRDIRDHGVGYDLATGRGSWSYTPGAPTSPSASGTNGVTLSWTAPTGAAATSYNIYRGTSSLSLSLLVTGVTGTTYNDGAVTAGTGYYYWVQAVNAAGPGPFSNTVTATASNSGPPPPKPGPPTSLSASQVANGVALSWTAPSGPVSSYTVLRGITSGGESVLKTGVSTTSYADTSATTVGTTYYYEVEAVNAGGTGSASNEQFVTIQPPPKPAAPANLSASQVANGVALAWNIPSGPVSSYTVLRGTTSGGETVLTSGVTTNSYADTSATTVGTTYYYEVEAVNAGGTGSASNEQFVTILGGPPVAKFSTSCSGKTCTFTSTSTDQTGTIVTYKWSFGDGSTGSGSSISYNYFSAGSFTVMLTVTDNHGRSSSTTHGVGCWGWGPNCFSTG